jgi:hypothetical protein
MKRIVLLVMALLAGVGGKARAETYLLPLGGDGGGQYISPCPPGQNLTGLQMRVGDDIDAIRPACAISRGPNVVNGQPVNINWAGGPGGSIQWLLCPASTPIVIGIDVQGEGVRTYTVNNIHLFCGLAVVTAQAKPDLPSAIFDAPQIPRNPGVTGYEREDCPPGQVAIGVHGRSGEWLDSVGLICGPARVTPMPASNPVQPLGNKGPGKPLGRVQPSPIDSAPRSPCESARTARERNSPAWPGLQIQCGATLAPLGWSIANQDPLSEELRRRAHNDAARRGFDIGMAIAEHDTEMGPGKQAMHDGLTGIEQAAYDVAVSFLLQRNRNAKFAATGAAIARADPAVAQARKTEDDMFYWLGFDIATGIFGDPHQGAAGNTATGPGSLKIRDALNATAIRGFNAAVAYHLARHY